MQGEYPLPEAVVQKFAITGGELGKNVFLMCECCTFECRTLSTRPRQPNLASFRLLMAFALPVWEGSTNQIYTTLLTLPQSVSSSVLQVTLLTLDMLGLLVSFLLSPDRRATVVKLLDSVRYRQKLQIPCCHPIRSDLFFTYRYLGNQCLAICNIPILVSTSFRHTPRLCGLPAS